MKKFLTVIFTVILALNLVAQVPESMSYQAVIRNANNELLTNQSIGLKISIVQADSPNSPVYQEVFTPNPVTNDNGLISIEVGKGTPTIGSFADIDWSLGSYFINTETDPEGGTNYTINGLSQLLSVPYALYSKNSGSTSEDFDILSNKISELLRFSLFGTNTSTMSCSGFILPLDNGREVVFKPDGTQFSVVSRGNKRVYTHTLSTPWDVSTAGSTASDNFSFSSSIDVAHGLHIRKGDGKKMWIWNRTEIYEYELSTAWQVSSATQVAYKDFSEWAERGHDIDFSPDGRYFYFDDRNKDYIAQFELSTPWDITTAEFVQTKTIDNHDKMRGLEFTPDGLKAFINNQGNSTVFEYHLNTPWDISTMSFNDETDVSSSGTNARSITWNPDGKSFYIMQTTLRRVCRYFTTD